MREVTLTTFKTSDEGTFSKVVTDRGFACFAGELPWRDNHANRSCIPGGLYSATWRYSPAHGWCYHIDGVPGRANVEIHAANLMGDPEKLNPFTRKSFKSELLGCVAPGLTIGRLSAQEAILKSAVALAALERDLQHAPFKLVVVRPWDAGVSAARASR
jgi:hypothetical protein